MSERPPFRMGIPHRGIENHAPGCGLTGLYCIRRPQEGDVIDYTFFGLPDGTVPNPEYAIRCGVCGHDMVLDVLRFIHEDYPRLRQRERAAEGVVAE